MHKFLVPLLHKIYALSFALVASLTCQQAFAHLQQANPISLDNNLSEQNWQSREYPRFIVNYPDYAESSVESYVGLYEEYFIQYQKFFSWTPTDKFHISLFPQFDVMNGFSSPLPFNQNGLFLAAYDELGSLIDRAHQHRLLASHELFHLFHLDKNSGGSASLRNILGRNLFTFPAIFQPLMFIEGLAVYFETDKSRGFGRGANSWYPARMRMELQKGLPQSINSLLNSYHFMPQGAVYLYGYYFVEYLVATYGLESLRRWIESYSNNIMPAKIDSNMRAISGLNIEQEWAKFVVWLEATFEPKILELEAAQKKAPKIHNFQGLKSQRYNQPFFTSPDSFVYFADNGYQAPSLIEYNTSSQEKITWLQFDDNLGGSVRYDFHPEYGLIFSQLNECVENGVRFDVYHYSPQTKQVQRLSECQSIRRAIWDEHGGVVAVQAKRLDLIAAKQARNQAEADAEGYKIIYIPAHKLQETGSQEKFQDVLELPARSNIESLDVFQDNLVLSLKKPPQGYNLYQAKLKYQDSVLVGIEGMQAVLESKDHFVRVRFNDQGKLHLIADVGGVFNLYSFDTSSNELLQLTTRVGGIVDYSFGLDGEILVSEFSPDGFAYGLLHNPRVIKSQEVLKTAQLPKPASLKKLQQLSQKDYSPFDSLAPTGWFPIFFLGEEENLFGFQTNGQDALMQHFYSFEAAVYSFEDYTNLSAQFNYIYDSRWALSALQTPVRANTSSNTSRPLSLIRLTRQVSLDYLQRFTPHFHTSLGLNHQEDSFSNPYAFDVETFAPIKNTYFGGMLGFDNLKFWRHQLTYSQGLNASLGIDTLVDTTSANQDSNLLALHLTHYYPVGSQSFFSQLDLALDTAKAASLEISENYTRPTKVGNRNYQLKGSQDLVLINASQLHKLKLGWQSQAYPLDYGFYEFPAGIDKLALGLSGSYAKLENAENHSSQNLYNIQLELLAGLDFLYFANLPLSLSYAQAWSDEVGELEKQSSSSLSLEINLTR